MPKLPAEFMDDVIFRSGVLSFIGVYLYVSDGVRLFRVPADYAELELDRVFDIVFSHECLAYFFEV